LIRVVAVLNPFKDEMTVQEFEVGTAVHAILKSLAIRPEYKIKVTANGEPVDTNYATTSGDLINIKVSPRGTKGAADPNLQTNYGDPLGYSREASVIDLNGGYGKLRHIAMKSAFQGTSRTAQNSDQLYNAYTPAYEENAPDPPLESVTDYGGKKDRLIPSLQGVSNRDNKFGRVNRLFSQNGYKVFPYLAANQYTELQGSDQWVFAVFEIGYGPLGLGDHRIGGRPIAELVPEVATETQYGGIPSYTDLPFTYYKNVNAEEISNEPLLYNVPLVKQPPQGQQGSFVGIDFQYDEGLYGVVNGGLVLAECRHTIEYRQANTANPWIPFAQHVYVNATNSTCRSAFSSQLPGLALWEFKITRNSIDDTPEHPEVVSSSSLIKVRTWVPANPFNPIKDIAGVAKPIARIAIQAHGSQGIQGTLDEYSCVAFSWLRHWNGTAWSALAITANCAAVALELLTGTCNYRPVPDSKLDLPAWKIFYDFCETNSFRFEGVLDDDQKLEDRLIAVCAIGRAVPFINSEGKYSVLIDKPVTVPDQAFSMRNIIKDTFSAKVNFFDPPHYLKVQFINPAKDWKQDERFVYDDGYDAGNATKFETIPLTGCMDATAAYKHGRYHLASNRLRPWTYQFDVDVENLVCSIGSLIKVVHDVPFFGLGQARIKTIATTGGGDVTGFTIDSPLTMEAAKTYGVVIRQASAASSFYSGSVVAVIGDSNLSLTLSTPIPAATTVKPIAGDLVLFGLANNPAVDLIVLAIEQKNDFIATITAVDAAPAIWLADTGVIPVFVSNITRPAPGANTTLATPQVVSVRSNIDVLVRALDGSLNNRILIAMEPQPSFVSDFQYQVKRSSALFWGPLYTVKASSLEISIEGVEDLANYDVQIRNATTSNRVSDVWNTSITNYTVIGKSEKPADVTSFRRRNSSTIVEWNYTEPRDHAGFQVRMCLGDNRNWDQGTILAGLITSTQYDLGGLAKGLKTIMVKAVDTTNNYSVTPAYIGVGFGDVEIQNVIITDTAEPLWTDWTITNGTISGGEVVADSDGSLLWGPADVLYWGQDTALYWGDSYLELTISRDYTPPTTEIKPFRILLDETIIASGWRVEYSVTGGGLYWGDNATTDTELYWNTATGSGSYWLDPVSERLPMPTDGLEGEWQKYTFYIVGFGGLVQARISHAALIRDVPDLIFDVSDFVITAPNAASGARLDLTGLPRPYREITNVQLTLESDTVLYPNAVRADRLDKLSTGPLVKIFDSTGTGTTGRLDATIKGY